VGFGLQEQVGMVGRGLAVRWVTLGGGVRVSQQVGTAVGMTECG
jgi:hypothetical protein